MGSGETQGQRKLEAAGADGAEDAMFKKLLPVFNRVPIHCKVSSQRSHHCLGRVQPCVGKTW